MRVTAQDTRWIDTRETRNNPAMPQYPPDTAAEVFEDAAAIWEPPEKTEALWEQRLNTLSGAWENGQKDAFRTQQSKTAAKASGPRDDSGRLTRRLVDAETSEEVRLVLSEAYQNLAQLRMAAMSGDAKEARTAMSGIKRLNKLIQRGQRKLRDLGKENLLRQKREQAEDRQQEQRVKELKDELRRRILERKSREKQYLRDAHPDYPQRQDPTGVTSAALEAKIAALAAVMAQATAMPLSAAPATAATAADGTAAAEGSGAAAVAAEAAPVTESAPV